MKVYLVQHGAAHAESLDPARPLTSRGEEETRQVAALASRLALNLSRIIHSGKLRAEQTAAILAQSLLPRAGVTSESGLAPNDDPALWIERLARLSEPVMIVGHLPFLARLTGLLLAGDENLPCVRFGNSAIVCLSMDETEWQIDWILTPEMAEAGRV
jgi:phosphohistidine phosphatase